MNKILWRFDAFYSLPSLGDATDGDIEWNDFSEQVYLLLPDHIVDAEDARRFVESVMPTPPLYFAGFTQVPETHQ